MSSHASLVMVSGTPAPHALKRNMPPAPGEVVCLSPCVSPHPRADSSDAREYKPESAIWRSAGFTSSGIRPSTRKAYKEYEHHCNIIAKPASHLERSSIAVTAPLALGPPVATRQDSCSLPMVVGVGCCFLAHHIQWLEFSRTDKPLGINGSASPSL